MKPTFKLTSKETGTEYLIYVDAPRGRGPWPVMLFMDGDDQFAPAVKAYRALPKGTVRPLLLVGVGYGASYMQPANRRGRDYTPVRHSFEPSSGGADAFLKFLVGPLRRELGRRYAVHPRFRGIGGHSLGSLLVLHAPFQKKPAFSHFLGQRPGTLVGEPRDAEAGEATARPSGHAAGKPFPRRRWQGFGIDDGRPRAPGKAARRQTVPETRNRLSPFRRARPL